jgi:hypothetical protein
MLLNLSIIEVGDQLLYGRVQEENCSRFSIEI